ncbi:hypothetical protein SAMN02745181_3072 [Rubritalea squalenifaciens DSM 18772]|uniref:Uncharacterized protein n=1 Tax=Rubritalea squalenifaciens DSM 18772 TaxID=1123071 RepID=A0A1M6P4K7_9BACT|nr:hypothetical protein SAMN02745181_3072 [Rubritalea squalenifaciens DSM 18772]
MSKLEKLEFILFQQILAPKKSERYCFPCNYGQYTGEKKGSG